MGYEDRLIQGIDGKKRLTEEFSRNVEEKSAEILKSKRLSPENFRGIFSDEKIADDMQYVQERRRVHAEGGVGGHIFEGFIHQAIGRSQWFGRDAQTLSVSEYDDFKNGVDVLVEYGGTQGYSHLALGIDVTYNEEAVSKKIEAAFGHLRRGNLTTVEYFESPKMGLKGTMSDVPSVVIGLQKETVIELMKMFEKDDYEKLSKEISQFIILEQIKIQIEGYLASIPSLRFPPDRQVIVIQRLQVALGKIKEILVNKKDLYDELFTNEKDYQKVLKSDVIYNAIRSKIEQYTAHSSRRIRK